MHWNIFLLQFGKSLHQRECPLLFRSTSTFFVFSIFSISQFLYILFYFNQSPQNQILELVITPLYPFNFTVPFSFRLIILIPEGTFVVLLMSIGRVFCCEADVLPFSLTEFGSGWSNSHSVNFVLLSYELICSFFLDGYHRLDQRVCLFFFDVGFKEGAYQTKLLLHLTCNYLYQLNYQFLKQFYTSDSSAIKLFKTMFGRNMMAGNNGRDCWNEVTFTFKFYFISSFLMLFVGMLFQFSPFVDNPYFTVFSLQLWRPFFAMYGQYMLFYGIIRILIAFCWLTQRLPQEERQYSTVYSLVDIFIYSAFIHIIFNIVGALLVLMFGESLYAYLWGFGWFPIIMIIIFRQASTDPEGQTRFCCLPFLIKRKHLPWVLLGFSLILAYQMFIILLIASIIGYYQSMIKRQNLLKLPLGFYKKLQACLPADLKKRQDFVLISGVQNNLKTQCCGGSHERRSERNESRFKNPFAQNNKQHEVNQVNIGGGVPIDENYQQNNNYSNHWKSRNNEENNRYVNFKEDEESKETEEGNGNKKVEVDSENTNKDLDWV